MCNSNETNNANSNINTKEVISVLCSIVLGVFVIYIYKFHYPLSETHADWGTFGDYFGGILNPVIAAFAFWLIAKTYELQKRELEATRSLLEVSTDAQKNQIKLAALTSILNSNLTKISILQSERSSLLGELMASEEGRELISRFNIVSYIAAVQPPDSFGIDHDAVIEWRNANLEYQCLMEELKQDEKGKYFLSIIRQLDRDEEDMRMLSGDNERLKKKIEKYLI